MKLVLFLLDCFFMKSLGERGVFNVEFTPSLDPTPWLWHQDGYHKLTKYHFVIHAAVDGFSRTCLFLFR